MITTAGRQQIASCDVFPDDEDPLLFYVVPPAPRIAIDENGKPIFSLIWYRRDLSQLSDEERKTRIGGGILSASVELRLTAAEEAKVRDVLAAANAGPLREWPEQEKEKLRAALKLATLPVTDGSVGISILAEAPDGKPGEFVASLVGAGAVSMTGSERASFMAKLTQDGAVLVWDLLTKNLPAIRIEYDLKYNYRVLGLELVVWCHASKAYSALHEKWDRLRESGSFAEHQNSSTHTFSADHAKSADARDILSHSLVTSEYAGVNVQPSAGPDVIKPEAILALTEFGEKLLQDYLSQTFLEAKVGEDEQSKKPADQQEDTKLPTVGDRPFGSDSIDKYDLKSVDESVLSDLYFHLQEQAVVLGRANPNDNLGNVLAGYKADQFRVQVDIDDRFYAFLDVQVLCTANFDEDPVALVRAHLEYSGDGPTGKIHEAKDFAFQKGTPPQRFSSYLGSASQRSYSWDLEIFFKGTTDTFKQSGQGQDTILVLDLDKLGILKVDVAAGIVVWDSISQIFVAMECMGRVHEFILDAQHQTHRWTEVIASSRIAPYTYEVTWVDKSGQRIPQPRQTSTAKQLVLNQPISQSLQVVLIATGSFGTAGISQIAVALRYSDPGNDYDQNTTVLLTKEGDSKTWTVPLIDRSRRSFQYKVAVFYNDGITREDAWRTTDAPILPVGDPFGFRVEILPYLLKDGPWAFGTVDLRFDDDAGGIHTEKTFELKDFSTPMAWRFRLAEPSRHDYRYQMTLYRKGDGKEVKVDEAVESKEVLVLVSPASP